MASRGWALPWAPSLLLLFSPVPKVFTEHTLCALSYVLRGVQRRTEGAPPLGDASILVGEAGLEMRSPTWPTVMSCEEDTDRVILESQPQERSERASLATWRLTLGSIRAHGEERRWQEIRGGGGEGAASGDKNILGSFQEERRKPVPFRCCCLCCLVAQFCNPMDCSPPGSSIHGIFKARILEWVAISSSKGSSPPRD